MSVSDFTLMYYAWLLDLEKSQLVVGTVAQLLEAPLQREEINGTVGSQAGHLLPRELWPELNYKIHVPISTRAYTIKRILVRV